MIIQRKRLRRYHGELPSRRNGSNSLNVRKKKLKRRATAAFIFETIYAFATVVSVVAAPFGDINTLFSMGWVLRLLLSIVMLVLCIWTGDGIKNETGK